MNFFRGLISGTPRMFIPVSCFEKSSILFKSIPVEYFPEAANHSVMF